MRGTMIRRTPLWQERNVRDIDIELADIEARPLNLEKIKKVYPEV